MLFFNFYSVFSIRILYLYQHLELDSTLRVVTVLKMTSLKKNGEKMVHIRNRNTTISSKTLFNTFSCSKLENKYTCLRIKLYEPGVIQYKPQVRNSVTTIINSGYSKRLLS